MSKPEAQIPKNWLVNPKTQLVLFLIAIAYIISPVDLIPDVVPVVGWADDIGVLLTQLISFMLYLKEKRRNFHKNEGQDNGR